MPRIPSIPPEDELESLPPLDGDTEETDETGLELDDVQDSEGDSLDDSTSEDAPVDAAELDLKEGEATWLNEAGDSADLDLGEAPLDVQEGDDRIDADDEAGPALEDVAFDDPTQQVTLDTGDEGPVDPDDELRDEELPSLDADDEGEGEDASFWEGRLGADEPIGFAWASRPWARVGAPLPLVHARALACGSRGALVAARTELGRSEIVRVDLEGSMDALSLPGVDAARVARFSAEGGALAVVLDGGGLLVTDGASATGFRQVAGAVGVADAVIAGGVLWLRTSRGALLMSVDGGRSVSQCAVPGTVAAIGRESGDGAVALAVDEARQPVALLRCGPGGAIQREPLDAPAPLGSPAVFIAASGEKARTVAYVARTGRLIRREADGAWRSFDWEGRITALSCVDDGDTILAATYSEADDATALVRVHASGEANIVARLGAAPDFPESDGRAVALACDDSRGVVWIAGGFGVAAFAIAAE
jgi:hypothetical protein